MRRRRNTRRRDAWLFSGSATEKTLRKIDEIDHYGGEKLRRIDL
jgi:hypothetical protein